MKDSGHSIYKLNCTYTERERERKRHGPFVCPKFAAHFDVRLHARASNRAICDYAISVYENVMDLHRLAIAPTPVAAAVKRNNEKKIHRSTKQQC